MCKWSVIIGMLLFFPFIYKAEAQNTSNKGKEFWIVYAAHIDGTASKMYLYITSDVNTTATVRIGGTDIGLPFIIEANKVTSVPIDPKILDVYIGTSDVIEPVGKAIQVIAEKPVVVYAHIFKAARSAATLVLPAKVLGREYYTSSYSQNKPGGEDNGPAVSEFTIIGVEDNTTIEITPVAGDINGNHSPGQTFQKMLQKGEIYQYQSDTDLSGSHIISVAGPNGTCKPIAVFSGSSWVGFCSAGQTSANGGDNLYQQLYPITAWGKEFITAPMIHKPYDIFRVYFSKDNTALTINGENIPSVNNNKGKFYEFRSANPNQIVASEPISVVQYQISEACDPENIGDNPIHPGDPEMTILNPVEQTLSKITVYSALRNQTNPPTNINQHYINVIIRDEFKSSFTINGVVPQSAFTAIGTTGYSYLQEDVTASSISNATHTLMADGGFSAIAYGYGHVESYGYLAGADVKNLYQNLQISNAGTQQPATNACTGQATAFTLILPYRTNSLTWVFDGVAEAPILNPEPNETEVVNGIVVYKYSYSQNITYNVPGTHELKVNSENPNPSGCDANEEIVLDFEVFDPPTAKFSASSQQTCIDVPITITDQSIPNGKDIVKWHWDFGDGSTPVTLRTAAPFDHAYAMGGDFSVTLWVESESGCGSLVTSPIIVHVVKPPVAKFKSSLPSCKTKEIIFTDESVSTEGIIKKWYWDFGDRNATTANPNVSAEQNPAHIFSVPGTYIVSLIVETDKNCSSITYSLPITIHELPVTEFEIPDVCVSDAFAIFNNSSANVDGTISGLTYLWDFGDPSSGVLNTTTDRIGRHKYAASRNYDVKLTVINQYGCSITVEKTVTVNGSTPTASFEVMDKDNLCSNKDIIVKNTSFVAGFGKITRLEWYIDGIKIDEDEEPVLDNLYALNYPAFTSPLTKAVQLKLIAYSGNVNGPCQDIKEQTIILNAAPLIKFESLEPICENAGKVQIEASETGNLLGSGMFSGPGITSSGFFDPAAAGVGTHELTYTFTANNGCIDVKNQSITVYPIPIVSIAKDMYALIDGTIKVNASVTEPGLKFKWIPSSGLDRDDILNPVISANNDIVYTLKVTSTLGCDVAVKISVHVKRIDPANAFSPNGDSVNDVWNIKYIETYPNVLIEIFNRYGEKVFLSQGYTIPFDGNYKGQPLPVGTYYYVINPKNGGKVLTGSLTLIR